MSSQHEPTGFLNFESQTEVMKKLLLLIASFAIMLVASSSFVDKRQEAVVGEIAPQFVVGEGENAVSLASLKGNWVILSFWSASDAASRMSQNRVASFLHDNAAHSGLDGVEVISVNFDRSENLMREIAGIDNLDADSQFHISDENVAMSLRRAYCMNEGLRTFLIGPDGSLVAADPTDDDLRKILG